MNLEYLMVYQASGLPIFSKCFKGFCTLNAKDPMLLSGFLTALQSFGAQITNDGSGSSSSLEAVKIGPTVMRFSKVLPSGHNVVIGLSEDSPSMARDIFDGIDTFIRNEYADTNWTIIDTIFGEKFGELLVNNVLAPLFHNKGGWEDTCPLGDACAMKALPVESTEEKISIWGAIKERYRSLWKKKGMNHTI
ncbi:MAG: hypothetical protein ACW97Z_15255 [Candidatus Hodarchaeales archaeon]|jgi:hypothetical protein